MANVTGWFRSISAACGLVLVVHAAPAYADEIWVAPTYQQDLGGVGASSNTFWPVTAAGAARLAWAVPNDLQALQSAKVALIPGTATAASSLNVFICTAQNHDLAGAACSGPFAQTFSAFANQLTEVEIGGMLAPRLGTPGVHYLAVLAYTTPTTATDHVVGLRFTYAPKTPAGIATLAANTFTGTQTAPAFSGSFNGNGSGLTDLPFPSGAATLGANTFSGAQTAPSFVGSFSGNGSALTNLPLPVGVATSGANTFTGTQTAPAFAGDGSALTNLPFPAGAATLGANTFSGAQTAPAFVGNGAGLFNLPFPAGAATLGANTFTSTQTIDNGNLDLDTSTATSGNILKNGTLFLHTFGTNNVFMGLTAGNTTTIGTQNVGLGSSVLHANTNGTGNTGVGHLALQNNTTGGGNAGLGWLALSTNNMGNWNTAAGANVLSMNTTGSSNTAVGFGALGANNTGGGNLALGYEAGANATTGSNNIYLGANISGVIGESNTMYLGKVGTQTKTLIAGVRGTTTVNPDAIPVVIDSAGQLGTISSSARFKEDVYDMGDTSRRLLQLRPVTFRYTQAYINGAKPIQYGLIAEEVAAAPMARLKPCTTKRSTSCC